MVCNFNCQNLFSFKYYLSRKKDIFSPSQEVHEHSGLDHILDEFDGQCHRSKVTRLRKVIFSQFYCFYSVLCYMIHYDGLKYGVM